MKKKTFFFVCLLLFAVIVTLVSCDINGSGNSPLTVDFETPENPANLVKNNVSVTYGNDSKTIPRFNYNENWFLWNSYEYNADLAKMSIGLTLADDKNSVEQLYGSLDFPSSSYGLTGYDQEDNESVAMAIASKTIKNKDDTEVTLVVVNIRSSGYGNGG